MIYNIDEDYPKLIIATRTVALTFISLVTMTACSTFNTAHKNESVKQASPAAAAVDSAVITGHKIASDENHDDTTDEWEKARAAYLRDLDYAELFRQNNNHNEVKLKSDLIESRYQIKSAETALYEEENFPKALIDLRSAEKQFNNAIELADRSESKVLKATKPELDDLLVNAQLSTDRACIYPQTSRYSEIEAKIENLLLAL